MIDNPKDIQSDKDALKELEEGLRTCALVGVDEFYETGEDHYYAISQLALLLIEKNQK